MKKILSIVVMAIITSLFAISCKGVEYITPESTASPVIVQGENCFSITCATKGAKIYYTINGTTPTSSSTLYYDVVPVTANITVKAIAKADGYNDSQVVTKKIVYEKPKPQVVAPKITQDSAYITIYTETPGASIYYTTDGTTPDIYSTKYKNPFIFTKGGTIKAVAVLSGYTNSPIVSQTFEAVFLKVSPLTIVQEANTVTITCELETAKIYYSLEGTTSSVTNTQYKGPFNITENARITAVGRCEGYEDSDIATSDLTYLSVPAATPIISRDGNAFTIISTTNGAKIYYTINGTTPTQNSTLYTGKVSITKDTTVKAIAIAVGYETSKVAIKTINWMKPTCATPVIERPFGKNYFRISCETEGASIFYTTDGTTPTPDDMIKRLEQIYIPIATLNTLTKGENVIKAIAVKEGYNNSSVATKYIYY